MSYSSFFSGIFTALITPFQLNGSIDWASLHKLLSLQQQSGVDGVVVLGTTGESPTLSESECLEIIRVALEYQTDKFKIIAGSGSNCTESTKEKCSKYSRVSNCGRFLDGLMVVTPYYNKPAQEHLILHFSEIFQSLPEQKFCLYNVPGRTGVNLFPQTFASIVEQNPNVFALKEASGNINAFAEHYVALKKLGKQKDVSILSGDDSLFIPSLLNGASGLISVTSNAYPETFAEIGLAAKQCDFSKLKSLQEMTFALNTGVFTLTNPVGIKAIMHALGLCENVLRKPLFAAKDAQYDFMSQLVHVHNEK